MGMLRQAGFRMERLLGDAQENRWRLGGRCAECEIPSQRNSATPQVVENKDSKGTRFASPGSGSADFQPMSLQMANVDPLSTRALRKSQSLSLSRTRLRSTR